MKRLIRLLMINWYRLDQASVEIEGHAAVIGPNASGKSSLLDAIQAVLVGGDKRWWSPNASAGEKSTRSLRDYCLGVVRDPDNPDLSQEFRPREQAITYLALVFRDTEDGSATSIGLAMHARLEESQEQIDGRFIAPGLDLRLADLVDQTPDGATPMPWKRLREAMRGRLGAALRVHPQVGEYQRELCHYLYDGKRTLDRERFLRAFRNAITFSPIRNVSGFVRDYILEERPIQVRSLQQALQQYRQIQISTQEARRREQLLSEIDRLYRRAEKAECLALAWRWVEQEAAFNALETEMEPLRAALSEAEGEIVRLDLEIADLEQRWKTADEALQEANRRLAASDIEQQRRRIDAELETLRQGLAALGTDLERARQGLGAVHPLLDHAEQLADDTLTESLQAVAAVLVRDEGLLAAAWPAAPKDVMRAAARLRERLAQTAGGLKARYEALVLEEAELDRDLRALKERIERLRQGGSDLQPNTLRLIELLRERGIEAVPLCDRVDVADEPWRDALEAFLGGHREALLVDPAQVSEAITLYRREGRRRGIHGSRIINTLRTDEWTGRRDPGSLAEVTESDDRHAVAYVNRHAGNVLRVETEDELVRHERAITADGMLATGGSVVRLQPEEPMLGRAARALTQETLERRFAENGRRHYEKQQEKTLIARLREELVMPLERHLDALPDLARLVAERGDKEQSRRALKAERHALDEDASYQRLQQNAVERRKERDLVADGKTAAVARKTDRERSLQRDRLHLDQREHAAREVAARRTQAQQAPGFDARLASERLDELRGQQLFSAETPDSWRALSAEASRRAVSQEGSSRNARNDAAQQITEYWAACPPETRPAAGAFDDHRPLAAWVLLELTQIRDTQLARYVTEAENALREAEYAFRADFVGKLQENLKRLEDQRVELNRNLRHRPFHGQYYSFVKHPEPDLRQVLDWVLAWSPEQGRDVGGLFDAADDPNHPHREAIRRIRDLLMEAASTEGRASGWDERLADYRQYYHFDVRMSDKADGGGNPELLSRRLSKGSGGEHQSPFYVAIGAALAAAYRIERQPDGGPRGGIALAVFDEAFSKLDLQNTVSALGFLTELGLQVILAAPDEKYGQIAENVDTIVNVYRDGGSVYIDTEYIKPEAQRALAADNPVLRPTPSPARP
ncbi:SbcC/MukB-like Walker B domain-containing protein [Thiocystis violacea]|uniref:SbcC/MukB-like Walker B domain-containing protein n=1 Tax=Thiocystis violacea TaxID=13725 RepID=UPI001903C7EA|nr:SbcC/MukB-like Walker B domain-containing protein [Thiocystis violacea]MBK1717132.1 hypothetical protein [Thiocystis violacea]